MISLPLTIAILLSYLIGSVPFGLLIGRCHGIDLRQVGSKNIGATNCGRQLGRRWGLLCFILDALKGAAPTLGSAYYFDWFDETNLTSEGAWLWVVIMAMTIIGHMAPIWLKFRGGKGVATSLGAMASLWPYLTWPAVGSAVVWLIMIKGFRYVSLASVAAAASLPLLVILFGWLLDHPLAQMVPFLVVTTLIALLVIVRHRTNLIRWRQGTEARLGDR